MKIRKSVLTLIIMLTCTSCSKAKEVKPTNVHEEKMIEEECNISNEKQYASNSNQGDTKEKLEVQSTEEVKQTITSKTDMDQIQNPSKKKFQ